MRPKEHNLHFHRVKSFLLVPHLPILVAMVGMILCLKKVSNLIFYFIVIYLFILFLSSAKAKNTKCCKRDKLQPNRRKLFVLLISLCVKGK